MSIPSFNKYSNGGFEYPQGYPKEYMPSAPPLYPEPSAPPLEPRDLYPYPSPFPKPLAPSAPPKKDVQPQLDEDCSICLEKLRNRPDGDSRQITVLSKTDCKHPHFFHKFCLDEFLEKGTNSNCPLCRHTILRSKVTAINVNPTPAPSAPIPPSTTEPKEETSLMMLAAQKIGEAGIVVLSGVAALTFASLKLGGTAALSLLKFGFNSATSASVQTQNILEKRSISLFVKWEKMTKDFEAAIQTNKDNLATLLATFNSLPSSQHRYSEAALQRIERSTKVFEEKLKDIQNNFKQVLEEEKRKIS